jgi:hypothetical protein
MYNGRRVTEKDVRREIRNEQYSGNGRSEFTAYQGDQYKRKHR